MPRGMMLVQSRPADPKREDEFNDWYTNTHIPEVCAVPGIVAARRYKVHDLEASEPRPGPSTSPSTRSTVTTSGADARARNGRATAGCA